MMFAKNVLLGSLNFVTILMLGNWSGAIAQVPYSSRYLSAQEIKSLEPEFERSINFMNAFSGEALRTYSIQINRIVNAWRKIDPSMPDFAPFLGTWTYMDDVSLHIYPSQKKGQVCVVEAVVGYPPAYNFGTVQGDRLVSDGELGKIIITRKQSNRTRNSQEGVFLAKYYFANGKRSVLPLHFPRHLGLSAFEGIGVLDKGRFTRMGCITSLSPVSSGVGNNEMAIARNTNRYLTNGEINSLESEFRSEVESFFQSRVSLRRELSSTNLLREFRSAWAQFDPSITPFLGNWTTSHGEAWLDIYPTQNKGKVCVAESYPDYMARPVRVVTNISIGTVIGDKLMFVDSKSRESLMMPRDSSFSRSISASREREFLASYDRRDGKKVVSTFGFPISYEARLDYTRQVPDFARLGCTTSLPSFSRSIPSVPPSSAPVRPTDAIAKYPSNDEFKAFDNKFRGNADSLVKLRGNQADQRRKFQNEWKSRNPNAAKFLGAWYTGNRYFYVFPSTAKGGTCVVTQDANGKLDMKIGVALNQELRYDGGKGLFWRDRPNIVAARDSGSGSLYPIYATFGMPELPENMIGDMERQKCITSLPSDTVASSLPSPLYEDVTDPAFKLSNLPRINGMTKTFRVGLNAFDIVDSGQTVKLNSTSVKPNVPTIIIMHGWKNEPSSNEFRNLLKAMKYNSSMQVLVVDWGQGAKTGANLDIAAARIEATAGKVADLIKKYKLKPSDISLIGHSLGAHVSVDVALALQNRKLGNVKSITLLDPAVDMPTGYTVKNLSDISKSTFIRAFYTSAAGSSSFAASADESYNIVFPSQTVRMIASDAHGEAMTLLANSFQGDSNSNRNCIAEQFTKLDQQFPSIPQNTNRERPSFGTKPSTDLFVAYDSNKWLYPVQISKNMIPMVAQVSDPKTGVKCVVVNGSEVNILK